MRKFINREQGRKLFIFFMLVTGLFFFYSFIYQDILITTKHGMNFWSCLTDGKLLQFYSYNKDALVETAIGTIEGGAYYDFPIYLIFAVWNLPLKVVEKLFAINVFQSLPCLMWMKSILLVFAAGMLWILKRIGILLGFSDKECKVLYGLFLSSAFFVSAVVIIGQYDIIAVFFMLCGVYCYLRRQYKLFAVFFMIAIPLKMFSLFCYIALILYKEKTWYKITGNIIFALSPMLLLRFLMPFDGMSNDILVPMFLLSNSHGISLASVSAVVIPMVIVYFICWFREPAGEECLYQKEVIYICFGIYAVLFGCIVAHPYWIIYLAPFTELLIVSKGRQWYRVNIFLETVMAFFYIAAEVFKYPACYASDIVANMLTAYLSGNVHRVYDGRTILEYEPLLIAMSDILTSANIMNIATGIFVASLIFIAFLLRPSIDLNRYKIIKEENGMRGGIYFRLLAGYFLCLIPLVIYLDIWNHWILK